jgi:hypothetical protein
MSPREKANQIVIYLLCGLSFSIIAGMFMLTSQGREYPQSFENIVMLIIGGILGALKLQTHSNNS